MKIPFRSVIVTFIILIPLSIMFIASKSDNTPQQYWVSPTGNDTTGNGTQNNPWQHLNYAMQQIGYDSTNGKQRKVNVLPGVYSPSTTGEVFPVRIKNNVWLKGTDSSTTILDAENTKHVLDGWRMKNITISDLTIQNGYYTFWDSAGVGGISCRDGTTAEIFNCIIQYCDGGIFSGNEIIQYKDSATFVYAHHNMIRYISNKAAGIYGKGGDVTCENNKIVDCDSRGIDISSGGASRAPRGIIRKNIIRGCFDYGGGAIAIDRKYNLIENNIIINNETDGDPWFDEGGGAISAGGFSGDTIIIRNNFMVNNLSRRHGGALASIRNHGVFKVTNNVIAYNRAYGKGAVMVMHNDDNYVIGGALNRGNDMFKNQAGQDSINLFYHASPLNDSIINCQYNYLGSNPQNYHLYSQPDSLFDISNYTDTMNVCGKIFNCDSLFQALGITGGIKKEKSKPVYSFQIYPNYPNPFNPVTYIKYELLQPKYVQLKIYNTLGQEIIELVNEEKKPGSYVIPWNGMDKNNKQVSSGLYFYLFDIEGETKSGKMIFTK